MKKNVLWMIVIILVVLFIGCQHISFSMNFDNMRNPTDEENRNNAYNRTYDARRMTADENYIVFSDQEAGLVGYEIKSGNYFVLEKGTRDGDNYDSMQIYDGQLYYRKYDMFQNQDIWRVDLETGKKEKLVDNNKHGIFMDYFNVYNDIIISLQSSDLFIYQGSTNAKIAENVSSFALLDDNLYFISDGALFCLNLLTNEKIPLNYAIDGLGSVNRMFLHNNKIYIFRYSESSPYNPFLDAVIEDNNVRCVEGDTTSNTYLSHTNMVMDAVFYDDYIITNAGIFDLDGKLIKEFEFGTTITPKGEVIDRIVRPLIVGGNLYVYSEEVIDLPSVGNGWYKLDIESYI